MDRPRPGTADAAADLTKPKRKRPSSSPTKRSLEFARKQGWTAGVVERWNQYAKVRQDLLGCIDLIVCTGTAIIGVQACAGDSHANRRAKVLAEPRLQVWLASGGCFEIWSWAKQGARGEAKRWKLRREAIEADGPRPVTALPSIEFRRLTT